MQMASHQTTSARDDTSSTWTDKSDCTAPLCSAPPFARVQISLRVQNCTTVGIPYGNNDIHMQYHIAIVCELYVAAWAIGDWSWQPRTVVQRYSNIYEWWMFTVYTVTVKVCSTSNVCFDQINFEFRFCYWALWTSVSNLANSMNVTNTLTNFRSSEYNCTACDHVTFSRQTKGNLGIF